MRIFKAFDIAFNEIRRDLAELGVKVPIETMQNKVVEGDPDLGFTHEVYNYGYIVTKPDYTEIPDIHLDWVTQEWQDRLAGSMNPGRAWRTRPEVWEEFLIPAGRESKNTSGREARKFDYTYSDRMGGPYIQQIIDELAIHPHSRQLWLPVWDRQFDAPKRGKRRVPCSLGYWFLNRDGKLHITYMMRSCDFATHFPNDVALASMLQEYVAEEAGLKVGTFTHFIGSLHVYAKDVEGVF